ncbi:hypothetical protein OSB04_012295 [Centaurea solstitialis]|uniref:Integrase zinc-binding domain-containing protein n=1 Tax=Centaurea solstitialis TaxID=347529 RepID=A0AA38TLS3_9ASTR|nr:hypothetical protein OSB04_012295 [Centaurea solstitialis]
MEEVGSDTHKGGGRRRSNAAAVETAKDVNIHCSEGGQLDDCETHKYVNSEYKSPEDSSYRLMVVELDVGETHNYVNSSFELIVVVLYSNRISVVSSLLERIKTSQTEGLREENLKEEVMAKQKELLTEDSRGLKLFQGRIWVPKVGGNRELLLNEAHKSKYSIHPGSTKMYRDLKMNYWWPVMKLDVASYVEKCVTCLQVKVEHQKPYGSLQPLDIPEWKWEHITMDFVTKLPRTLRGHDTIWVIVD